MSVGGRRWFTLTLRTACLCGAVACGGAQRPAGPTSTPAAARPAESVSPFHVIVEGRDGYPEWPASLHLCPADNAIFVCDPSLLFQDGAFVDAGTAGATVVGGTWPDNLWGVQGNGCVEKTYFDPHCVEGDHLMRWNAGWERTGFFIPHRRSINEHYFLGPWLRGSRLAIVHAIDLEADQPVQRLLLHGNLTELPENLADGRYLRRTVRVGPDRIVLVGHDGLPTYGRDIIELWGSEGRLASAPVPDQETTWIYDVYSWTDMIALDLADRRALRFDGETWHPHELPAWGHHARSHQRDGDSEWVVMTGGTQTYLGNPTNTSLFHRVGSGNWEVVPLPPPRFAQPGDDHTILPISVHVADHGDVWVRGRYVANCHDRGVILHNRPPDRRCFLERRAATCSPEPKPVEREQCGPERP